MKKIRNILFLSVLAFVVLVISSCNNNSKNYEFKYWNEAESLTKLKNYVTDVTNEKSDNFIPKADRIAVFDMDGTLCGELFPTYLEYLLCAYRCLKDDTYTATDEMKAIANEIVEGSKADGTGKFSSDMPLKHARTQAKAFEGMTITEFDAYVKNFLNKDADGFKNMKYSESLYLPMIEVVSYLQQNDFITYVVSGSDRFICRSVACEKLNIPQEQVIGMDVAFKATGQGEKDGLDYQYQSTDKLVRSDELLIKNLKLNKVLQIAKEIGRQPVLSFGNSSGDSSMHKYTLTDNKYKSEAFMLIADDETRDYGNTEKNTKLGETWKNEGFNVISMKNDFKTIYGYNVEKTTLTYNL